jgi:hypothetical protein
MKTRIVLLVILLTGMLVTTAGARTESNLRMDTTTSTATIIDAKSMLMRLDTISATDQSNFTRSEKRVVRREARSIRATLRELRGARYIRSATTVLLVFVPVSIFFLLE